MNIDYQKLGKRLKETRVLNGYTQEQFGDLIHCSSSHISNVELGRTNPSLDLVFTIANVLGTGVDYLLLDQFIDYDPALVSSISMACANLSEQERNLVLKFIEFCFFSKQSETDVVNALEQENNSQPADNDPATDDNQPTDDDSQTNDNQ